MQQGRKQESLQLAAARRRALPPTVAVHVAMQTAMQTPSATEGKILGAVTVALVAGGALKGAIDYLVKE